MLDPSGDPPDEEYGPTKGSQTLYTRRIKEKIKNKKKPYEKVHLKNPKKVHSDTDVKLSNPINDSDESASAFSECSSATYSSIRIDKNSTKTPTAIHKQFHIPLIPIKDNKNNSSEFIFKDRDTNIKSDTPNILEQGKDNIKNSKCVEEDTDIIEYTYSSEEEDLPFDDTGSTICNRESATYKKTPEGSENPKYVEQSQEQVNPNNMEQSPRQENQKYAEKTYTLNNKKYIEQSSSLVNLKCVEKTHPENLNYIEQTPEEINIKYVVKTYNPENSNYIEQTSVEENLKYEEKTCTSKNTKCREQSLSHETSKYAETSCLLENTNYKEQTPDEANLKYTEKTSTSRNTKCREQSLHQETKKYAELTCDTETVNYAKHTLEFESSKYVEETYIAAMNSNNVEQTSTLREIENQNDSAINSIEELHDTQLDDNPMLTDCHMAETRNSNCMEQNKNYAGKNQSGNLGKPKVSSIPSDDSKVITEEHFSESGTDASESKRKRKSSSSSNSQTEDRNYGKTKAKDKVKSLPQSLVGVFQPLTDLGTTPNLDKDNYLNYAEQQGLSSYVPATSPITPTSTPATTSSFVFSTKKVNDDKKVRILQNAIITVDRRINELSVMHDKLSPARQELNKISLDIM